jgi:hypothetical protein
VRLRVSRRTQSKGIWGSTSKLTLLPLTLRFIGAFRCCFDADCLLLADASRCWGSVWFKRFVWWDLCGFFCKSVDQPALRGASSYWGTRNRQPPLGLTAQLWVGGRLRTPSLLFAVWVRVYWVGDDFWYPSMRSPPNTSSPSELRKYNQSSALNIS